MRRIAGSGERAPRAPSAGTTSSIRARSASVRTGSTAAALFSTCAGRELPASGTTPSPRDRTQAKATWAALAPWLSAMPVDGLHDRQVGLEGLAVIPGGCLLYTSDA